MTGMRDPDAYIDAAAAVVGVRIEDAWRPGVARFLDIAAGMAAILDTVPLADDDLAPAPVFLPPEVRR
jgi:hypothetical protein